MPIIRAFYVSLPVYIILYFFLSSMKILVCFSGGKDSQACLIKACRDFGASNVEAVFCDTGWEHDCTYEHIHYVVRELGCQLTTLKSHLGGFRELCLQMKWFPDTAHRRCTTQLKIWPMIDYILGFREDVTIIQGIRSAESKSRAKLTCSGDYFEQYHIEATKRGRLYRVNDVKEWCAQHRAIVERPMFGYSAQDVIDFILDAGQRPNPLYTRGFTRVGCFPCIYAKLSDIKAMRKDNFYVERVRELEREVNLLRDDSRSDGRKASLLPVGKIPPRFCLEYGNGVPSFGDVVRYVSRDDAILDLFDNNSEISCMSIYHGLCE